MKEALSRPVILSLPPVPYSFPNVLHMSATISTAQSRRISILGDGACVNYGAVASLARLASAKASRPGPDASTRDPDAPSRDPGTSVLGSRGLRRLMDHFVPVPFMGLFQTVQRLTYRCHSTGDAIFHYLITGLRAFLITAVIACK